MAYGNMLPVADKISITYRRVVEYADDWGQF